MASEATIKDEEVGHLSEELKDAQEKCQYFESEVSRLIFLTSASVYLKSVFAFDITNVCAQHH